jgi:hypothetical protein
LAHHRCYFHGADIGHVGEMRAHAGGSSQRQAAASIGLLIQKQKAETGEDDQQ